MYFLGEPHLRQQSVSQTLSPLPICPQIPQRAGCGATSGGAAPRGTPSSAVSWEEGELATLFLGSSGLFK